MGASYVEANLLDGEELIYEAHLHSIIFAFPVFLATVGLLVSFFARFPNWGDLVIAFAALLAVPQYIALKTSEFAVTNRRVLIKVGWLRRRSLELLLQKVESVSVDQSIMGRMFNFGTIGVRGTGGTRESFSDIAQPLEFRRQVQALTDDREPSFIAQAQRTAISLPAYRALPNEETKKCPHCLSDIPAAATACRFCARDVVIKAPGQDSDDGQRVVPSPQSSCNHVWKAVGLHSECKRCGVILG